MIPYQKVSDEKQLVPQVTRMTKVKNNSSILQHHIQGYEDFFSQLKLATSYSLHLQGDKIQYGRTLHHIQKYMSRKNEVTRNRGSYDVRI